LGRSSRELPTALSRRLICTLKAEAGKNSLRPTEGMAAREDDAAAAFGLLLAS